MIYKLVFILILGQKFSSSSQQLLSSVTKATQSWNTFRDVIDNLERHENHYSGTSRQLVSEVKRSLSSARNSYNGATRSVYDWCDTSVPLMERNLESLKNNRADENRFLDLVDTGVSTMNYALSKLNDSTMEFNTASGKLETLGSQLSIDFRDQIKKLEEEEAKVREAQWWSWLNFWVGAIVNLIAEVDSIPKLRKEMDEVNGIHRNLRSEVDSTSKTIDQTKVQIRRNMMSLGDMRGDIKNAGRFSKWPQVFRKKIEDKLTSLIGQCKAYEANLDRT